MARSIPQESLFIPDDKDPDALTVNPEALAPDALAKRAFDMMPIARERDRVREEQDRMEMVAQEHMDDNPRPLPPPARRKAPTGHTYTRQEEIMNARRHAARAYRLRWGR